MKKLIALLTAAVMVLSITALTSAAENLPEEKSLSTGDYIVFGAYEQDNDESNGKEPVEWKVLSVEEDRALVISRYCLYGGYFDKSHEETAEDGTAFYAYPGWAESEIRTWLNEVFINDIFTPAEQEAVIEAEISTPGWTGEITGGMWDNIIDVSGGEDTEDKMFFLSVQEVCKYLLGWTLDWTAVNSTEWCAAASEVPGWLGEVTDYAIENRAYKREMDDGRKIGWWWLRSPGDSADAAAFINQNGFLDSIIVSNDRGAIRPAFYLDLSRVGDDLQVIPAEAETASIQIESGVGTEIQDYSIVGIPDCETGSYINFGTYEQDGDAADAEEDIIWKVIDIQDGKALVISLFGLDCVLYNNEFEDVNWETCTLRNWLNNDFLNTAFSDEEQARIAVTDITIEGKDEETIINDKVFALSPAEANQYFPEMRDRICYPTEYTVSRGCYENDITGACWWWTRDPAMPGYSTGIDTIGGNIRANVNSEGRAVRPAMWISLE